MPRVVASRELLAPREDVWNFIADPYRLADWWPGVLGVQPDRKGLTPGARWLLNAGPQTGGLVGTFMRRPQTAQNLVVMDVRRGERVRFLFANDGVEAEITLEAAPETHTRVTIVLDGPWSRVSRSLPHKALGRLYALCQTAADA
jgi:uncharacterized protein YndB with AHSA1/START domain